MIPQDPTLTLRQDPTLTTRQKQVIALTILGRTSIEIGRLLGISHKTVECCKNDLCRRLQVHPFARLATRLGSWHIDLTGTTLTAQEKQVLTGAALGLTREGIAAELSVTVKTANNHLVSTFAKLDVHSLGRALAAVGTWTAINPSLTEMVMQYKEKLTHAA